MDAKREIRGRVWKRESTYANRWVFEVRIDGQIQSFGAHADHGATLERASQFVHNYQKWWARQDHTEDGGAD